VVLDLSDTEHLASILADRDTVYLTIAPKRQDQDYRSVYLAGVNHLLDVLPSTPVRRVIYTSSTRVYGQDDGSWVDEDSPTVPKDEKGQILLKVEQRLLEAALDNTTGDKRAITILRLSGIIGPGRDPADRIRLLTGTNRDDGNSYVNLIHRDQAVAAMIQLRSVPHTGVLNLSDDTPQLRRLYYDLLLSEAGLEPIRWEDSDHPSRGKRILNDRIKKLLDINLRHPIPL